MEKGPLFGQRHVLVFWGAMGFMLCYMMRVNLSVALVAMIDLSAVEGENKSLNQECMQSVQPSHPSPSNSSRPAHHNGMFQWSRQLQGLILSAFYWCYFILQVPLGAVAQRHGGKWIFGAGVIATAVLTLLTPLAAFISPYLLIILRVVEGLTESVTYPSMQAILSNWVPREESSTLVAFTFVGNSLGAIVGQLSSGSLAYSSFLGGWPSIFYIHGGAALLWFLPWSLCVFDTPIQHPRITTEERMYIHNSLGLLTTQSMTDRRRITPWRKIFSDPPFWAFLVASICFGFSYNNILTTTPQFLSDVLHFDIKYNGIVSALPFICMTFSQLLFSVASDQIIACNNTTRTCTKKIFTLFGFLGLASCQIAIVFSGCDSTFTVALLCMTLVFSGLFYGGYISNAIDLTPEYAGAVFGLVNSIANLTGIVAPLITDKITEHETRTEWNVVFYLVAGISVFGGLFYTCLGSADRRHYELYGPLLQPPDLEVSEHMLMTAEDKEYGSIQK